MSDFLFCLVTILYTYLSQYKVIFKSNGLSLFLAMYGGYLQNVFIKSSTWLVVILAMCRNAAISFPGVAKQYVTVKNTLYAMISCFVFWLLFYLPLLWVWTVQKIVCPNGTELFHIYLGQFGYDTDLRKSFTHSWTVIGFIFPVVILAYCNVNMIISLRTTIHRTSMYMSPTSAQHHRRLLAQRRMTITLIAIVVTFFILVFPSECIGYYQFMLKTELSSFTMLYIVITFNALQNINMAINFVLYCAVNSNFRKTLRNMLTCNKSIPREIAV